MVDKLLVELQLLLKVDHPNVGQAIQQHGDPDDPHDGRGRRGVEEEGDVRGSKEKDGEEEKAPQRGYGPGGVQIIPDVPLLLYQCRLEASLGEGLQGRHGQQRNPHQAEIGWGQDTGQDDGADELKQAVGDP